MKTPGIDYIEECTASAAPNEETWKFASATDAHLDQLDEIFIGDVIEVPLDAVINQPPQCFCGYLLSESAERI